MPNEQIAAEIVEAIKRVDDGPSRCLHNAHIAIDILTHHGYYAVLQAGTMQWPCIRRSDDDGKRTTHFSYMWAPPPWERNRIESLIQIYGALPEIHVWAGIMDTNEIVDFSTRHFKDIAVSVFGLDWTADDPPPYLWCKGDELPDWVNYIAYPDATVFAGKLLKRLYDPQYLVKRRRANASEPPQ